MQAEYDSQIEGLDFFDTYAPTCKPETFRILLAIAAQKDLHLGQMDVKSAYLHSKIEEEIYLEQPRGFVKKANSGQKLVCKLKKSIYGLKQATKNWCEALTSQEEVYEVYFSRKDSSEAATTTAYL